ncbi:MAG TPA: sulfotransferase [Chloroflexota bacterium]
MNELRQPIFVVGCPRSGTTLVQCILSASSHAFSLPETHFFSYVLEGLGSDPSRIVDADGLRSARAALEAEADLPPLPDVWTALHSRTAVRALDIFVALVEHYRPEGGAALRAIEKTPRHVLHLATIAQCFPDARFVNVIRDPVDVASSLLGVPFESSRSVLSYAQRWTESVLAARAFGAFTVHYETLIHEPESTTRELCTFLDLPFESAMLEEFGREAKRNIGRAETWKGDVAGGVLLNREGVWRQRMSPGQAWLVAQAAHRLRSELGYRDTPSANVGSIARATLGEFRVRFREARASTNLVGAARHAGSVLKALAQA